MLAFPKIPLVIDVGTRPADRDVLRTRLAESGFTHGARIFHVTAASESVSRPDHTVAVWLALEKVRQLRSFGTVSHISQPPPPGNNNNNARARAPWDVLYVVAHAQSMLTGGACYDQFNSRLQAVAYAVEHSGELALILTADDVGDGGADLKRRLVEASNSTRCGQHLFKPGLSGVLYSRLGLDFDDKILTMSPRHIPRQGYANFRSAAAGAPVHPAPHTACGVLFLAVRVCTTC